jgi:hypothetical protein
MASVQIDSIRRPEKLGFEVALAAPSSFWRFVSDMRA